MNSLLSALYDLLSFITEDAQAFGLTKHIPEYLLKSMNSLCNDLGDYLDDQEMLRIEKER